MDPATIARGCLGREAVAELVLGMVCPHCAAEAVPERCPCYRGWAGAPGGTPVYDPDAPTRIQENKHACNPR